MTQNYTPVAWQDETTSQQGTLINAERLNQMQTAHHYADGWEEVDAIPTADPGVTYHKVVYCTADSTFYRWDGTAWTADIDDDTKRLLLEHEADHDNPHQVTKAQVGLGNADNTSDINKPVSTAQAAAIKLVQDYLDAHEANHSNPHQVTKAQVGLGNADNTADADKPISTAAQTALDGKVSIIPVTTGVKFYAQTSGGTYLYQGTQDATAGITSVPLRDSSGRIRTATPSGDTDAVPKKYVDDGLALKADKATTYTKSETDTLLASKADKADTLAGYGITDAYTKTEADTLLGAKADDNAVVHLAGAETIPGAKTFTDNIYIQKSTPEVDIIHTLSETNVTPTGNRTSRIRFNDKNNAQEATLTFNHFTSGDKRLTQLITSESGTDVKFQINVNNDATEAYMSGPSRAYNASNTADVATIGTLDAYAPMVRTTGNQTITGVKTFTGIEIGTALGKVSRHERLTGTSKFEWFRYAVTAATNTSIFIIAQARGIGIIGRLTISYDGVNTIALAWSGQTIYGEAGATAFYAYLDNGQIILCYGNETSNNNYFALTLQGALSGAGIEQPVDFSNVGASRTSAITESTARYVWGA